MKILLLLMMVSLTDPPINPLEISPDNAKKYVGERVKVCGKITEVKFYEGSSKQTMLSMATNNQPLNVIISFEDRRNFSYKPENYLKNKFVCITGKIVDNNGKTELILNDQEDLTIDEEDTEFDIKANLFDFFNKYFDDKE